MVTHDANGNISGTTTYTYTDAPNRFNPLGIVVMFGGPSLHFLHSFETLFNKNMIATFKLGTHISTCEYVYNTQRQLTWFREVWTSSNSDYLYENTPKVSSYK